ncbi:MAG: chorismate synthase [Verrucomicrobia bacterium]|nr:chorismate synthase [Verrucomicrobiota bacterium]
MASNSFGSLFCITTWGESHGKAIGVVIDGCPAGLPLTEADIQAELDLRSPGKTPYTSPRKEPDTAHIYSGVFEGLTTGTPISIIINNQDVDSSSYQKDILRPGHAGYTYLEKYGIFDYRGSGRASARETACRVAAGAIAKKLLKHFDIICTARLITPMEKIIAAKEAGDSIGGLVEFTALGLPAGLGDPIYEKLEAKLASAMLSIPASKAFEIGEGFACADMHGSEHNDLFENRNGKITTQTNHAGGTLGGISTGMPLVGRVAFKPASSIPQSQPTITTHGESIEFKPSPSARHDPCVAIRAVPVVEAMLALVLADALLMQRAAQLDQPIRLDKKQRDKSAGKSCCG